MSSQSSSRRNPKLTDAQAKWVTHRRSQEMGETIFTGEYKCDNTNLKLDFTNEDGQRGTIHALVRSFTETTLILSYEDENIGASGIRVQITLRKEE